MPGHSGLNPNYGPRPTRGNSYDRRRRRQYLLDTYGDGKTVKCAYEGCEKRLTFTTLTIDRWPVRGCDGGTYRRSNIRPACRFHNCQDGAYAAIERKAKA